MIVKLACIYFLFALFLGLVLELIYYSSTNNYDVIVMMGAMTGSFCLFFIHLAFKLKFIDLFISYCSLFSLISALFLALYTVLSIADVFVEKSANVLPMMRLSLVWGIPLAMLYCIIVMLLFVFYLIHRKYAKSK